jgi:hypothetical protein
MWRTTITDRHTACYSPSLLHRKVAESAFRTGGSPSVGGTTDVMQGTASTAD